MSDDAPRVPFLDSKADLPEEQYHNYERIVERRDQVIGPFGVLLNSPEIAGRTGHLGTYVRFESDLPGDVRELAIITTAREHDCTFEWATHEPLAREEGVSDATTEAIETRASLEELEACDAEIVRYGRELLRENEVSDETFRAVADRFGDTAVTELTVTFGYYSMLAVVLNALKVLPDEDVPTFE